MEKKTKKRGIDVTTLMTLGTIAMFGGETTIIPAFTTLLTTPLAEMIRDGSIVTVAGTVVVAIAIITAGIRLGLAHSHHVLEQDESEDDEAEKEVDSSGSTRGR